MTPAPGPPESEEDLLRAYGRYVHSVVRKFSRRAGHEFSYRDAFQVACIAMIRAVRAYDRNRINPESGQSYSVLTLIDRSVRRDLKRYCRDIEDGGFVFYAPGGVVRSGKPPKVLSGNGRKLRRSDDDYGVFEEEDPTISVYEKIPDSDTAELSELEEIWPIAEIVLTHREYWLLWSVYSQGRTMGQVGRWLGVSKGRVSQLHKEAIEKLRPHVERFA